MYSHTRMATLKPIILLAAVTLFCCPDARADIYKCSDDDGSLTFQQRANQKVKEVIATHRADPLPSEVIAKLEDIVARR